MRSLIVLNALMCVSLLAGCGPELVTPDFATPSYQDHPNLKIAEMARARGDLPQAIHDYRDIIKEEGPPCEPAYIGLGMALLDANAVEEAKKTFEKALALFPRSPCAFIGMGAVYLTLNQPENAIKSFDCALVINSRCAKALNGRGIALDMLGDTCGAQANYKAAIELDPNNVSYKSNLALSMALAGNDREAIRELEKLARSPCATPRVRQNLALAYGLAGNKKMARKVGRVDLSDEMVKNNINYIEAVRQTGDYAGLIPKNHTVPLNEGRKWEEGDSK
ncbi:MAG: tetratricopeptide repeat protein [Proteobacteria bacterium]|nr:tetratricopeptide repeat protein [Pseudomonadota bacterium]